MSTIFGRRRLAVALATGAVTLGLAGSAIAGTTSTTPATGSTGTTHTQHFGSGLLSGGLFKTIFGIFGAVSDKTPAIAAPIISDAVTAGTITQAQADQLTALFAAKHLPTPAATPAGTRSAHSSSTTGNGSASGLHHGFTLPDPAELKVLSQVMQAVAAQLPTIAQPVVDAAVTAGDITQSQADIITKVIGIFAKFKPGNFGITPGGTTSSSPIATLQSSVTKKVVAKAAPKHKKAKKHSKAKHSSRAKHSARAKH